MGERAVRSRAVRALGGLSAGYAKEAKEEVVTADCASKLPGANLGWRRCKPGEWCVNPSQSRAATSIGMAGVPSSGAGFDLTTDQPPALIETAAFVQRGDAQLYHVVHRPKGETCGKVLLMGPFASERLYTYISWVRWARYLATRGFEVLRFDYRGVGESTGAFSAMSFDDWFADVLFFAKRMATDTGAKPLALHGLRAGAILAKEAFRQGVGDSLLMWSPPSSLRDMLYSLLRLRLASDLVIHGSHVRKTRDEFVMQLERGESIDVDGMTWSASLWSSAARFGPQRTEDSLGSPQTGGRTRPFRSTSLDRSAGALHDGYGAVVTTPRSWARPALLNPNLERLFRAEADWILHAIGKGTRG